MDFRSSNDLKENESMKNVIKQQQDQIDGLKLLIKQLGDKIITLEGKSRRSSLVSNIKIGLTKSGMDLIDNNEKVKNQDEIRQITMQFQKEKELLIKQSEETILKQKNIIENMTTKVDNAIAIERLVGVQTTDINRLESELLLNQREYELKCERKILKSDMKYSELRKKMMHHIEKTQKNVEQMNLSHMDISTKLTLLQNHQLLMELEFQSQQVEELLRKQEINEKKIFQLERDIEIHNEVELLLADKNRKYLEVLKKFSLDDKFDEENEISKSINHVNTQVANNQINTVQSNFNVNTNPQTDENFYGNINQKYKYINNNKSVDKSKNLIKDQFENYLKFEKKIQKLEKIIDKKKDDYSIMKNSYDLIQEKFSNYEKKFRNLFNLFQDGLVKLSEDNSLKNSSEIYLNVENIKNGDFSDLSSDQKYAVLLILMKNLLPIINPHDLQSNESSTVNFQKVKVKYQLTKTNLTDPSIKRITVPCGSKSVTHKQKLSIDLPNIKKIGDRRFVMPNKPSVLF